MSEDRATRVGTEVQLGARARSILKSLAEAAPGRRGRAAAGRSAEAPPPLDGGSALSPEQGGRTARRGRGQALAMAGPAPGQSPASSVSSALARLEIPNTVVPLPRRDMPGRRTPARQEVPPPPVPAARPMAQKKTKGFVTLSAWLAIALPTSLAVVYYGFIASPQYVAEARFAVRGPDDIATSGDVMGALTGMTAPTQTSSDSYILSQFVESGQLVVNLQRSLDLRKMYTHPTADFLARYRPYDFDDTIEHLTVFWKSVAWVYFEPASGIVTFTVRAFTPEDALKIAKATVSESENLVNKLSERAREDAISLARQEQSRAELRLKFARKAVQDYRDRQGATDPQVLAASQSNIIATLEGQLAKQEADLTATSSFLNRDAPTVRVMRNNADALRSRITAERAKIGSVSPGGVAGTPPLISASLAEYENLATERDFAEKAYISASQAVEAARIRAERQSRYLATFVEPHLPEDSLYPARLQTILLVLVCATIAWAIGVLIFYGIRDHSA